MLFCTFYILFIFVINTRSPLLLAILLLLSSLQLAVFFYALWDKWLGLSISLIFSGGVIVLILFLVTLNDHKEIFFENSFYLLFGVIFIFIVVRLPLFFSSHINFLKLYLTSLLLRICFLTSYLFLTLLLRVSLCRSHKGRIVNKIA